jgi:hypothetical protein
MLAHEIGVLWAPTHPPSLNFYSSSSKAKPEEMQEIWDNTSVDPCLDLSNGLMRPYLVVPTFLMELWWNFSPCLRRLKDGTFRLCLSYLASSLKSIRENMILWFLNLDTQAPFLVCGSSPRLNNYPSHPSLYRLNMWTLWVRREGTTQVMYTAKLKDGIKRVTKTFSMIWKRFLKWYDGGGEIRII